MKPIINSYNSDINKNAYMNWRTSYRNQVDNLCVLADGYYEAAKLIADNVLEDNSSKRADALVYPMIFDLDQCIELYLKAIQWMLNTLLGNIDRFEGGHNLIGLYGTMIKLLDDFDKKYPESKGNRKDFNTMMSGVKSYIDELKTVVPQDDWRTMDFPRYPIMSDKVTDHFYIADKDNVTIDVAYFRQRIEDIHDALELLTLHFGQMIDYRNEAAGK